MEDLKATGLHKGHVGSTFFEFLAIYYSKGSPTLKWGILEANSIAPRELLVSLTSVTFQIWE